MGLSEDVQALLDAKVPEEEIAAYIKRNSDQTIGSPPPAWKETTMKVARPLLEAGGGIVGSVVGTGATPAFPPVGAVTGGVLGHAMGVQGADRLGEFMGLRDTPGAAQAFQEAYGDVLQGATYELGGGVVGNLIGRTAGGLANALSPVRIAQDRLIKNRSLYPEYLDNVVTMEKVLDKIPGLRGNLSYAQISGDPSWGRIERSLEKTGTIGSGPSKGVPMVDLIYHKRQEVFRQLNDFLDAVHGDKGSLIDALALLQKRGIDIDNSVVQAELRLANRIQTHGAVPFEQSGAAMRNMILDAKEKARVASSAKYKDIPTGRVHTAPLVESAKELTTKTSVIEDQANVPPVLNRFLNAWGEKPPIANRMEKKLGWLPKAKPAPPMTVDDLHMLRQEVGDELRNARSNKHPPQAVRRIVAFKNVIDDVLSDPKAVDPAASSRLREAGKEYLEGFIKPFKQGTVKGALKTLDTGEFKVYDQNVGKLFYAPLPQGAKGADDLINAIGPTNAQIVVETHAAHDLANIAAKNGDLDRKALVKWLYRNKGVLDKFGLWNKFKDYDSAAQVIDRLAANRDTFSRSAASKMLNVDVDKAVEVALSGNSRAQGMEEIMSVVGNNPTAVSGLQRAVKDYILKESKNTLLTSYGDGTLSAAKLSNSMDEYLPALRVLYQKEPQKLLAMMEVRSVLGAMARGSRATSVGSDTGEVISAAGGILAPLWSARYAVVNGIRMVSKMLGRDVSAIANVHLLRAAYDPEYAFTLRQIGSKGSELNKDAWKKIIKNQSVYGPAIGETGYQIRYAGTPEKER